MIGRLRHLNSNKILLLLVSLQFLTSNEFSLEMLLGLKDHNWKYVRSMMTPSFTTSKIRQAGVIIIKAVNYFR